MKTVKIKNTVPSKIEPTNFASIINDMPRVKTQSPQMTAQQSENFTKSKDIIENYNAQKKLQETYIKLKQNLEACREAKPTSFITVADQKSIDYFEGIGNQLSNTLLSLQQEKEITLQNFQNKIETAKRMLEELEQKMKVKEKKIDDKILIQNNRIQANQVNLERAKERTKQVKKTKEEIRLEKQLQQLLVDFKKTNPDKDLDYYFPNYKTLLGPAPLPPPQMDPPLPSVETNKNTTDDEDEEEEEEETEEQRIAKIQKRSDFSPWIKLVLCNTKKLSTYELYHHAIANGITPEIPEPPNPNKPVEDEVTLWNKMTPWQRFVKQNPRKTQYALYQEALQMGIDPDIPEPPNPNPPKPATHANKTVSRESLAKIIPGFN